MIKLRCSPHAAIGRLSHQSTVGRELVNGCMRWLYAIYYMPSTKIIGVSSGEGWDGAGEAGAEGHRQPGHRHGRQPPHGQVTRRNLTSSHHCFTSLTPQVFCDSLHHLCLHHSFEDNCLFHCYGKNVFLLRKWQQIEPKVLLPWYANIISHPSSLTDYFEVGHSWISSETSVKYLLSNPFRVQRSFGNHTWDIISIDSSEVNSW